MKKVLLFLSGVIVGIAATILFAIYSSQNDGIIMFEQPGKVITSSPLKVIQVLNEGNALAREYNGEYSLDGLIVFLVSNTEHFYDDQIVYLSEGECFKQIGVYTYVTNSGMEKTVPIVEALEK